MHRELPRVGLDHPLVLGTCAGRCCHRDCGGGRGTVTELEDGNRVTARVELGPKVPVAHVDEGVRELLGGFGDDEFSASEGAIEVDVGGNDGDVRDEGQGGSVGCLWDLLSR